MDFTAGLLSVTESVEQSTVEKNDTASCCALWLRGKGTNNISLVFTLVEQVSSGIWIIIYDKKYEYPGHLYWLCKYVAT